MNKKLFVLATMVLVATSCQKDQNQEDKPKQRPQQGGCCEVEKPQAAPQTAVQPTAQPSQPVVVAPEAKVEVKAEQK